MKKLLLLLIGIFLITFYPAFALAEDTPKIIASHGGQISEVGPYFAELVAKDGELILYIIDDKNHKISTEGGQAKATIRYGKNRDAISVDLKLAQGNTLQGNGDFQIKPDTTIVVFIKLADQEAHGSRFSLNSSEKTQEIDHHHDHDHDHGHDIP